MDERTWTAPDLRGRVVVVTGGSRGGGRGIATVLGECGATVYVTGRSVRGEATTENVPGTIDDTAEAVTSRGGTGIAVRCDHTDDVQVEALFERVAREQGRLDVLVNNAWGGYERYEYGKFDDPFWELPLRHWEGMYVAGVRAALTASRLGARLMLPAGRGLIVNTSAGDRTKYRGNLFYDTAKTAMERMAFGMARELRDRGIAAVAVQPGFMRTERTLPFIEHVPQMMEITESPEYVGRAVASLAADPNVMARSGQVWRAGELAREYGFRDVDGRQVPPFDLPE